MWIISLRNLDEINISVNNEIDVNKKCQGNAGNLPSKASITNKYKNI